MYYFAYGSCMDPKDLKRSGVKFSWIGPATLHGYRLAFSRFSAHRGGGVADVVYDGVSTVEGILYKVRDFRALDAREGAPYCYQRRKIEVKRHDNGKWVQAETYEVVRKSPVEFAPSDLYANLIRTGGQPLTHRYQRQLDCHMNHLQRLERELFSV